MIELIVYMDVLIVLNTLVDYFLLLASAKLSGEKSGTFRTAFSAFLGGLSALYIYLPPQKALVEFLFNVLVASLLSLVCFKWKGIKKYFKNTLCFLAVSCAYGGVMLALWTVFKPSGMVINNSVVYFSISPLQLVLFSVIGYIAFSIGFRIFKKSNPLAERCKITVYADGKHIDLEAIADTGNSLEDIFSDNDIIIVDKSKVTALFGELDMLMESKNAARYRLIPCNTVSGASSLEGFRSDRAELEFDNKTISLDKPILAISKASLKEDYNAIINPKILR